MPRAAWFALLPSILICAPALAGEFRTLSEAESYPLNSERQIFPTNQRADMGQIDLHNPTDDALVIWVAEDTLALGCDKADTQMLCKTSALHITLAEEEAPPRRFGFRTNDAFDWWVVGLALTETVDGKRCLRIALAEEVREGAMPAAGWPRRDSSVCVTPDGFAEAKGP